MAKPVPVAEAAKSQSRKARPQAVSNGVPIGSQTPSNGRRAGQGILYVEDRNAPEAVKPATPLASVPTNGKPRKNQAGLSVRELEVFRTALLEKRRELFGDMTSMERDALGSGNGTNLSNLPVHMADMGTDNYEQEFTLGLMEKDRKLLKEINHALAKIQDGSYGTCEGTAQPISKVRLEAQPWARFSIEHARKLERAGMLK